MMKLKDCHVAIVGLGLMGGSLALALKGQCFQIDGVDRDPAVIKLAREIQIVDRIESDPRKIIPSADLVILGAPVNQILAVLADLPDLHPGSPVVLDLGSTKVEILSAMADLPLRFDPIGGHPMCGKEKVGLANASADLFRNATFALTPLPRTSMRTRELAEQVVSAVGARPVWMEAEIHDRWTALTSHMPYLLACALVNAVPDEAQGMVGPGYRSTTRVAGTPSNVMLDVLQTNKENILAALENFCQEIDRFEECLRGGDWSQLRQSLDQAAINRQSMTGGLL